MVHFLTGHSGDGAGPFHAVDEDFVCDDVEFFLMLALNVVSARKAENTGKSAVRDFVINVLAEVGDRVKQVAELLIDIACRELFRKELL